MRRPNRDTIIHELEKNAVSAWLQDGDETDPDTIYFNDYESCFAEIDFEHEQMDIYMAFPYYDIPKEERKNIETREAVADDDYVHLVHHAFVTFLTDNKSEEVSEWDDGHYMCPGFCARVGYQNVDYSLETIVDFLDEVKRFYNEIDSLDIDGLRQKNINSVVKKSSFSFRNHPIIIELRKKKEDLDEFLFKDPQLYIGKEYVLVKVEDTKRATTRETWDLISSIIDGCELYEDIRVTFDPVNMLLLTENILFVIRCVEKNMATSIEDIYFKSTLTQYAPFASEETRKLIYDITQDPIYRSPKALILTEGLTDWKHIKHAFEQLNLLDRIHANFHEYKSEIQMGSSELLNMCRALSKLQNPAPRIMIFDRDVPNITKQVVKDESLGYKSWGNQVYSLVLPLPQHRESTPDICIEHYYTDKEICRAFVVGDIERRLYLGKEFDSLGRAPHINRLCQKKEWCGPNKINIIDNGVYELNGLSITNYALSKSAYADCMSNEELSHDAQQAFQKLFNLLKTILYKNTQ